MKTGTHLQLAGVRGTALRALRLAVALPAVLIGAWGGFGMAAHASLPAALSTPQLLAQQSMAGSGPVTHVYTPQIAREADARILPMQESAFLAPAVRASAGTVVRVAQWGGSQRAQNPIESFFSTIFGGGRQQADPRHDRTRILITPGANGQGSADSAQRSAQGRSSGGGSGAFCVRTCDGRFFPLGARVDRGSYGAGAAQCQSLCPAAQMELFTGSSDIASTVNSRGRSYSALPTAFLFRRQLVEGCSCHATGGEGGLRHIDIKDDPTLRAGDVVMTAEGFRVFTGGRRGPPFRDSDFVSPSSFPKLSKEMRQRLKELTLAAR